MAASFFQRNPGLVVILAGVAAALHVGKLSPAIPVLRDSLGVSLLQAGFLLSLVQMAGMLLGLVVGALADGVGLRRSMVTGLLILSIAGAVGALAQGPIGLLSLRACEGFGFLLTVMPAPGLLRRLTPPARLAATLGMWGAYMPFGTALALALGPFLIATAGWRAWWLLLALVSLAMAAWVYFAVDADDGVASGPRRSELPGSRLPALSGAWSSRARNTLSAPGPWLVAGCFALYSGQWLAVIGFLPSMAAQGGHSGSAITWLLALAALVNMVGNVGSGRLLQRGVPAHRLLIAAFGAMTAGSILAFADIAWSSNADLQLLVRYIGVLLFSMLGGMIPGTLFSLAVRVAPDEASVSTTVGWMQQLSAMGQFAGPPVVAWVAAAAGGWHWTWAVCASCCVLGAGIALRIGGRLAAGGR